MVSFEKAFKRKGDAISGLVGSFILILGGSELYGKDAVSFSLCLGGSIPVSSPYPQYS